MYTKPIVTQGYARQWPFKFCVIYSSIQRKSNGRFNRFKIILDSAHERSIKFICGAKSGFDRWNRISSYEMYLALPTSSFRYTIKPLDGYLLPSISSLDCTRTSSAHAIASRRPFVTSMPNHITNEAQLHKANRKGNPIQLFPDLSIIACMTLGPIMEEARLESPKRPKNCNSFSMITVGLAVDNYHIIEPRRCKFGHHRLRVGIIRGLEQPKHNIVCPAYRWVFEKCVVRNGTDQNSQTLWKLEIVDELSRNNSDELTQIFGSRYQPCPREGSTQ